MNAQTTIKQIGRKALVMIGAKSFVSLKDELTFRIGRNPKRITHIRIKLNDLDLYDMAFYQIRKGKVNPGKEIKNVYCDQLCQIIENETKLLTSL